MFQVGFIDLYLDEWHANNYPAWLKETAEKTNLELSVTYAYAERDSYEGCSSKEWCEKNQVKQVVTIKELVEKSDGIIVLAPDNGEEHFRLSQEALKSGKPVFIDKTFAFNSNEGKKMFELAKEYHTPMFSTSALRYLEGLSSLKNIRCVETTGGGGSFPIYLVHQIEMITVAMEHQPFRVKTNRAEDSIIVLLDYGAEQVSKVIWKKENAFQLTAYHEQGGKTVLNNGEKVFYFLMEDIITLFFQKKVPVDPAQTMMVVNTIEAILKSKEIGEWVEVGTII